MIKGTVAIALFPFFSIRMPPRSSISRDHGRYDLAPTGWEVVSDLVMAFHQANSSWSEYSNLRKRVAGGSGGVSDAPAAPYGTASNIVLFLSARLAFSMYAQASMSRATPLFCVPSHTQKSANAALVTRGDFDLCQ